jgi:hypothetical protein
VVLRLLVRSLPVVPGDCSSSESSSVIYAELHLHDLRAVVRGDELHDMIFAHGGDDSEIVAKKVGPKLKKSRR